MAKELNQLYPWRRANLEQQNNDTLELVPIGSQERYIRLIEEIGSAASILNEIYAAIPEAQSRLQRAYDARDVFCRENNAYD